MLSSVLSSILFAGLVASSVLCPIKPYDAQPGYGIACVYGDENGVYEDQLVQDLQVEGSMFSATLPFECIRQVGNANWLGYELGDTLCWVTEGNVQGEDRGTCFEQLQQCDPSSY